MGTWGIKALESDEGLDVIDIRMYWSILLRHLTDIKNKVPDEDGIRESVERWKNEDSGETASEWLEHLDWLMKRLVSEQGRGGCISTNTGETTSGIPMIA